MEQHWVENPVNEEQVDLKQPDSIMNYIKMHHVVIAIIIVVILIYYFYFSGFTDAATSLIPEPQVTSSNPYTSGADLRFGSTFSSADQGAFTSGFDIVSY